MNLPLTRDEAARLNADGRVVLLRLGDIVKHPTPDYPYHEFGLPAEFVEAAEPCETCEGIGKLGHESWHTWTCPDCLDGKRRIAAVVPCDIDDYPDCGLRSFVTVATVVVEWGPWLVTGANAEWVHVPPHGRRPITLPPDVDPGTIVGQYALAIRRVET